MVMLLIVSPQRRQVHTGVLSGYRTAHRIYIRVCVVMMFIGGYHGIMQSQVIAR
jgi:hypothetical protein